MSHCFDSQSIACFAAFLQSEEKSCGTVENYTRHLRRLAVFLHGEPLSKDALLNWKNTLQEQGFRPSTVNAMIVSVNTYLRWAGLEGYRLKTLRVQRQMFRAEARALSRADYDRLVERARQTDRHRLALVMETICATGIRVSELPYITLEAAQKSRADIRLKGKIRTILLPEKLCRKLKKYAQKQKIVSGEIFLTRNGTRLSRKQIWAEMKRLSGDTKIAAGKVFPHNLRRLFARTFYKASRDLSHLADLLGHSSIETTRIYLAVTADEAVRRLDRLGLVT